MRNALFGGPRSVRGYARVIASAGERRQRASTDRSEGGEGLRQQPVGFLFDHGIALAAQFFQLRAIQHRNAPAGVLNHSELLQLSGGIGIFWS